LYAANSASQAASFSGGTTPEIGSQRTIDRPDSVSRVIPPTTTIRKTSPAMNISQDAIAAGRGKARGRAAGVGCAWEAMSGAIWTVGGRFQPDQGRSTGLRISAMPPTLSSQITVRTFGYRARKRAGR
jgi:hypothetical protein